MKLGSVTALRLMWHFLKGLRGPRAEVQEATLSRSPLGHPWLVYSPRRVTGPAITLIHGVTARASEDLNLVHLARGIARLGHPCLTPPLDGLAHFKHVESDVTTVADALCRSRELFGTSTGVWAFSYGASYALSAASRLECRHVCRMIVAFGAYFRLQSALAHQRQLLLARVDPAADDADLLFLRYTLLICQREQLDLPERAWAEIEAVLADFMVPGSLEEKKRPLLEYASDLDYADLMARYQERPLSSALSPAGNLHDIDCPVALLHDPNDRFIPPDQVSLIETELESRRGAPKTRALTTPMLSHVQVDPMRNLIDAWRLIRLLGPLFE
jgi:pimeloyl-ACP methyl ester carboxylesterase